MQLLSQNVVKIDVKLCYICQIFEGQVSDGGKRWFKKRPRVRFFASQGPQRKKNKQTNKQTNLASISYLLWREDISGYSPKKFKGGICCGGHIAVTYGGELICTSGYFHSYALVKNTPTRSKPKSHSLNWLENIAKNVSWPRFWSVQGKSGFRGCPQAQVFKCW